MLTISPVSNNKPTFKAKGRVVPVDKFASPKKVNEFWKNVTKTINNLIKEEQEDLEYIADDFARTWDDTDISVPVIHFSNVK